MCALIVAPCIRQPDVLPLARRRVVRQRNPGTASRSRGLERPGFDKIAGSRQVLASGLDGDQGWPRESSCGAGGWCGGRLRRTISTSDTCVQTPGTASPAASTGITGSGMASRGLERIRKRDRRLHTSGLQTPARKTRLHSRRRRSSSTARDTCALDGRKPAASSCVKEKKQRRAAERDARRGARLALECGSGMK